MKTLAIAAALTVALTACGGGDTVDQHRVERLIAASIQKQAHVTATVKCPADIKVEAGRTFHCLARGAGQTAVYTVTIENKEGAITWVGDSR